MTLVGYYQACERLDDVALAPVGEKLAEKLREQFKDAVAFVVCWIDCIVPQSLTKRFNLDRRKGSRRESEGWESFTDCALLVYSTRFISANSSFPAISASAIIVFLAPILVADSSIYNIIAIHSRLARLGIARCSPA
jgi:hypothetical protein